MTRPAGVLPDTTLPGTEADRDARARTIMSIMRISRGDWVQLTEEQRKSAVRSFAQVIAGQQTLTPEERNTVTENTVALIDDYCARHPALVQPWMVFTAVGVTAVSIVGWAMWKDHQDAKKRKSSSPTRTSNRERVSGVRPVREHTSLFAAVGS